MKLEIGNCDILQQNLFKRGHVKFQWIICEEMPFHEIIRCRLLSAFECFANCGCFKTYFEVVCLLLSLWVDFLDRNVIFLQSFFKTKKIKQSLTTGRLDPQKRHGIRDCVCWFNEAALCLSIIIYLGDYLSHLFWKTWTLGIGRCIFRWRSIGLVNATPINWIRWWKNKCIVQFHVHITRFVSLCTTSFISFHSTGYASMI